MTGRQIIYFILFTIGITACNTKYDAEEKVLSDIFPQLIDSLHISCTNLVKLPPPPIYDKDSILVGIDSVAAKRMLKEYDENLSKLDSIDSRLLIGISDTSYTLNLEELKKTHYYQNDTLQRIIEFKKQIELQARKLDINLIETGPDFQLAYKSDLKRKYDNIWKIRDRKFGGIIAVSRVYFDRNSDLGLLQVDAFPYHFEGYGYFLIIERIDNQWKITRILRHWVT